MLILQVLPCCFVALTFCLLADASEAKRKGPVLAKKSLIGTGEPPGLPQHLRIFNPYCPQHEASSPRGRGISMLEERTSVDLTAAGSINRLIISGSYEPSNTPPNPVFPIEEPRSTVERNAHPIPSSSSMSALVPSKGSPSPRAEIENSNSPVSESSNDSPKEAFTFSPKVVSKKQSTSSQSCCTNYCIIL